LCWLAKISSADKSSRVGAGTDSVGQHVHRQKILVGPHVSQKKNLSAENWGHFFLADMLTYFCDLVLCRTKLCVSALKNSIYAIGGSDGTDVLDGVEQLSLNDDGVGKWKITSPLLQKRSMASSVNNDS